MGLTLYVQGSSADVLEASKQAQNFLSVNPVALDGQFDAKWIKAQLEPCLIHDQHGFRFVTSGQVLSPDWRKLARRVVKAGRKTEGLLRALKLTPGTRVIDATAGLGVDSLLMASTGAQVTMIERHPVLALLLSDQLLQIAQETNWRSIAPRLNLVHSDALSAFKQLHGQPIDVVYLDPMFGAGSYRAKVSGNMQLLHSLSEPPSEEEQHCLLEAAMKLADKVVVKRATSAPPLAGLKPQAVSTGDSVRYDIYTQKQGMGV